VGTCTKNGINLLKQGQEPRTKLVQRFKDDTTSVLLGLESFWAGVDVPGESCSVVIIDRLPFPTPDDPVLDVLSSADRDWFFKYSIPRAMIAFKQGVGRLVRSHECHGVVVCLDKRLASKRYGKEFLRSLPPGVPKTTRLDAIVEWLNPPPAEAWDAP
jgi:ATP-dependent DNA helicase DinG